ncbi:MAG: class I SAM-dependent methyltransferase [Gemmatimonadaceae bacterium]|jgi:SAM-dependent methyltransferase|nr:class I SAM-dependent methyltransferase [Gemmatimonadaceae bacterium]
MSRERAEDALETSWTANAAAWTAVVREDRIASRVAGTNAAIVSAITARAPRRLLDVGCGEGWLVRACTAAGAAAVGIDISAPLIDAATAAGGGHFVVMRYDELASRRAELGDPFDLIVCNFAVLGESLVPMLRALREVATDDGALLIQTVHPWVARGDAPYADGWRTETFAGFGNAFPASMPWFYRTLGRWIADVRTGGWQLEAVDEPLHPETGAPLSLLLVATPMR